MKRGAIAGQNVLQRPRLRVVLVDYPYPGNVAGSYPFTKNICRILEECCDSLWVISGNIKQGARIKTISVRPHFLGDIKPRWWSLLMWIIKGMIIDAIIAWHLAWLRRHVDIVILFMMHPVVEIVPALVAKALGKRVIKVPVSPAITDRVYGGVLYRALLELNLRIIDYCVPEYETTTRLLSESGFRHVNKLLPATHFYLLELAFRNTTPIAARDDLVGYVGGFRQVKGVLNFVDAIPLVIRQNPKIRFLIAGEGSLRDDIMERVRQAGLDRHVCIVGWIPREALPLHLNSLKLLVIPSYSEGVPNIAIEAIACGTPLLSTRVGVIPLLIEDGWNGFLLEDNASETIANAILTIMAKPSDELEEVANRAKKQIQDIYVLDRVAERWRKLLSQL